MTTRRLCLATLATTAIGPRLAAQVQTEVSGAGARHRSQVRIRDPFVLPDPATKTYYVYSSTTSVYSPNSQQYI